jgi:hypothetical protein
VALPRSTPESPPPARGSPDSLNEPSPHRLYLRLLAWNPLAQASRILEVRRLLRSAGRWSCNKNLCALAGSALFRPPSPFLRLGLEDSGVALPLSDLRGAAWAWASTGPWRLDST